MSFSSKHEQRIERAVRGIQAQDVRLSRAARRKIRSVLEACGLVLLATRQPKADIQLSLDVTEDMAEVRSARIAIDV